MITALEAYEKLLLKVNRDDSNGNVHIPRGKFVLIYNEQAALWLSKKLEAAKSSEDVDGLDDLLVADEPLKDREIKRDHVAFTLPAGFHEYVNGYCLATKQQCVDRPLVVWNTKAKDLSVLLHDENTKPSFEYEETLCSIASGKVRVYFTDFSISDTYLTYYRKPSKIDVEGYIKLNGERSRNIDPDVSETSVDEIISLCAAEIMRNNQNAEGLQYAKDRIQP